MWTLGNHRQDFAAERTAAQPAASLGSAAQGTALQAQTALASLLLQRDPWAPRAQQAQQAGPVQDSQPQNL